MLSLQVQKEVQEKRRKEKKEMMEAVKKFRKGLYTYMYIQTEVIFLIVRN